MAIVKANYQPRAKTGAIGRSVAYYAWRDGADHPRETPRTWHAADGRALDFDQARAEIAGEAKDAAYTYRVVLSTRDVELEADDYREVLDGHFERWYFTEHHGAEHPHAHAIAFSDHRLDAGELRDMRGELASHEQEREREAAQEVVAPDRESERVHPDALARAADGVEERGIASEVAGEVLDSLAAEALAEATRDDDQQRADWRRWHEADRQGRDGHDAGDYDRSE